MTKERSLRMSMPGSIVRREVAVLPDREDPGARRVEADQDRCSRRRGGGAQIMRLLDAQFGVADGNPITDDFAEKLAGDNIAFDP